jgi:hypothetical protein
MTRFVGLDVSQKMTVICVVDDTGRRLWRGQCPTVPEQITALVRHARLGHGLWWLRANILPLWWTLHGNAPHNAAPSLSHLEASRAELVYQSGQPGPRRSPRRSVRRRRGSRALSMGKLPLLHRPLDLAGSPEAILWMKGRVRRRLPSPRILATAIFVLWDGRLPLFCHHRG